MLGKLFERRYFHSDSRLVPSGEGPPVTSGDCLLSISGLFAEVASRSLCSHAIMNACADHRSSSPCMKMKTAEEFKIYRGFGVGEVRSPNHLLAVNRLGSCLHAAF